MDPIIAPHYCAPAGADVVHYLLPHSAGWGTVSITWGEKFSVNAGNARLGRALRNWGAHFEWKNRPELFL